MATYQILYWRDIPAQVRVYDGKRRISRQLPQRFQNRIDKVAMQENIVGSDAYLEQWHWSEKQEMPGTPQTVLNALIQELSGECKEQ